MSSLSWIERSSLLNNTCNLPCLICLKQKIVRAKNKRQDTVSTKIPLSFTDNIKLLIMLIFDSSLEKLVSKLNIFLWQNVYQIYIFWLYHCAKCGNKYLAMNTECWVYDYPSPAPESEWGGEQAGVLAWVRREEYQGVHTGSLASAFLLLRWHREMQAVRQHAVYENAAVTIFPGLLLHHPVFIAIAMIQANGRITASDRKINSNSLNITIFFLVHPVFCILCLYGCQAKVGYLIFTNWCFRVCVPRAKTQQIWYWWAQYWALQILLLKYIRLQTPLPEHYYPSWGGLYPLAAFFCQEFWHFFRSKVFYFYKVGARRIVLWVSKKCINQKMQLHTESLC